MTEDIQLLRQYAETRAQDAFASLVERHISFVYSAALRQLGGAVHRAEDVTQSVFVDLARRAGPLSRRDDIVGWLYTSTRYAVAHLQRAEARRQRREQEAHTMHELLSDAAPAAEWEKLRPVLDDAMHALSEQDRQAILHRFFKNERFADVGRRLGLSEDGARMRVERALGKLHALLAKRGITSTTAALSVALTNEALVAAPGGLAASVTGAALSGAAATGAGAGMSFLQFMSTTKFIVSAATVLALLALGTAGYNLRVQRQAEASLTAANRNQDQRLAKLRELERRAQMAERAATELKADVTAAETSAAAQVEAAQKAAAWDPKAEGKAFLQRHPAVKQAYIEWLDSMMTSLYADFWKSLRLTPTQIEQFKLLQRGGWTQTRGIRSIRSITSGQKLVPLRIDDGPIANPAAYRAILGAEGFRQYGTLIRDVNASTATAAREQVALVARGLCFTEAPLTPQQAEQLTQIVAESLRADPAKRDWNVIDAKAKDLLSVAQLPAWEPFSALGRAQRAAELAQMPVATPTAKK